MNLDESGAYLQFLNVDKTYDQKSLVVNKFNLSVERGEFLTLLGPSGSGKTTVLMMLAGFESVTGGEIFLRGQSISKIPPYQRNIGIVFQNYALFPHMNLGDSLAYPLKLRKWSKAKIKKTVEKYLDMVEMGDLAKRYPAQLSGGQRQRVALARALIFEPTLVLMDEPLGALDRQLREQMQFEITRLHKQLGFTVVYVTHDQTEALTMSNRIAVFNQGTVQQCDSPDHLYERPTNAFVAGFIGENNMLAGTVTKSDKQWVEVTVQGGEKVVCVNQESLEVGERCVFSVRPEKILPHRNAVTEGNQISAVFQFRHYVGDFIRYYFQLIDGAEVAIKALNDANIPKFTEGEKAVLVWQQAFCFAYRRVDL